MVHPWKTGLALPDSVSAILAGPGLAANDLDDNYKNEIRSLWLESSLPVIIDATALDWLPSGPTPRHAIRVITPHPGEAARLLGIPVEDVQANRPANLRALSQQHGDCWVVLKGRHTLIGKATGDIFINSSGNPFLAQGGSGDVLAGFLSGLLAQTPFQATLMKTLRFGVWEHGHIADRLNETRKNWTPEDLINELGNSASRVSATGLF
jgi:NAD(P)H-hydrate epimerase